MLYKRLCKIHLFGGIDANVLELDALRKCDVSVPGLSMFLAEFRTFFGAIFQLLLSTVPRRAVSVLDVDGIVAGELKSSGNKPVDVLA